MTTITTIKTEICKFALVLEVFFCTVLLAAVIQATLPWWTALFYAAVSVVGADWLCRVLLPRHPRKVASAPAAAATATAAPCLQVVTGGHAA